MERVPRGPTRRAESTSAPTVDERSRGHMSGAPAPAPVPSTATTDPPVPPQPEVTPVRAPDALFDWVETTPQPSKPRPPDKPGYILGTVRGTVYEPVFGEGKNWFTRGLSDSGNWVLREIQKAASAEIHKPFVFGTRIPLGGAPFSIGFEAGVRKIAERDLAYSDPRKLAIELLRDRHPNALPIWLEMQGSQNLQGGPSHSVPLGPSGAYARFGFQLGESITLSTERLLFLNPGPDGKDTSVENEPVGNRLQLTPFVAEQMARMEPGASFKVRGAASLRLDAALGFGVDVLPLGDYLRLGASVEAGAFAALSGDISLEVRKLADGHARTRFETHGNAQAGVTFRAMAGVVVNRDRIAGLFRGFVDYIWAGGDPHSFDRQLATEEERRLAKDAGGYLKLLLKNLAENAGRATLDGLIQKYATAYIEARAGIDVGANRVTEMDFDLNASGEVALPRADMVPQEMRGGKAAHEPLRVSVKALARLAYDMAVRGDLRLAQQLCGVRNSGVRCILSQRESSVGTEAKLEIKLPFIEYSNHVRTSDRTIDLFTPEMGRERMLIAEFSHDYRGVFGHAESAAANVRVHSPDGAESSFSFQGSDENFSADFVVQNRIDPRTSFSDLEQMTTLLDALSNGALAQKTKEALASGRYRDDKWYDDINPIHQLFFKPKEFGRSVVHLHVWLGEKGLRRLLQSELSEPALMQRFGRLRLDVADARQLTRDLLSLREKTLKARTPKQEEAVAKLLRDFLKRTKERVPAYAALATLVPENERAIEMRVGSIVPGRTPIRFTYLQDGRTSELLRIAGLAKVSLEQYTRYQSVLDTETRLRLGSLLSQIHGELNAPSPDLYRLHAIERRTRAELDYLDQAAEPMRKRLEEDLGFARSFIGSLPDVKTIEAAIPGERGTALATLRMNALRALAAEPPDPAYLRALIKNLLAEMPSYRAINEVVPLLESTAHLANGLAAEDEKLAATARDVVGTVRVELAKSPPTADLERAKQGLVALHGDLSRRAGRALGAGAAVSAEHRSAVRTDRASVSLARERNEGEAKFVALSGDPNLMPISYFERAGVIPPSYMGTAYKKQGATTITGAMVSDADLAMAASRPSNVLAPPALTPSERAGLAAALKKKDVKTFLASAERLRFAQGEWIDDPERQTLAAFAQGLTDGEFAALVNALPGELRRPFEELRASPKPEGLAGRYAEDIAYLTGLLRRDPRQMASALDSLGYGARLRRMGTQHIARLEAVFSSTEISGDELLALVKDMNDAERKRFYQLLYASDLRPQTRARLAGAIVDDTFFLRTQEDLVAALCEGMSAADLRIFFDQLHHDGKLEDFLSAGSFWQTLIEILTFGLARLFFHDNAAARRVVARLGYTDAQIELEYSAEKRAQSQIAREAESVVFRTALDTIPMDPALRHGLELARAMIGNVKYYDFADFPGELKDLLSAMAKGASRQLVRRIIDVSKQNGSSLEDRIVAVKDFFKGLDPKAIAATFQQGELDSSTAIVLKAIADGAIAGVIEEAANGNNKFINQALVLGIVESMNLLDRPITFWPGSQDPRVDQAGYDGLVEKWEFMKSYTGLDYTRVRVIYGGLAKAAGAVTFADTVSINPEQAPMLHGRIQLADYFQQVIAFHESAHILQQQIYGASVNAFIDQGIKMSSSGDRNGAYRVDEEMFDRATSIHDFRDHWEQQAELLEQSLRLLWARRVATGSSSPAVYEAFPGETEIVVSGAVIRLTAERWNKMLNFVREFGNSARGAVGGTGGNLIIKPIAPR